MMASKETEEIERIAVFRNAGEDRAGKSGADCEFATADDHSDLLSNV
jgi:hypothetical protein